MKARLGHLNNICSLSALNLVFVPKLRVAHFGAVRKDVLQVFREAGQVGPLRGQQLAVHDDALVGNLESANAWNHRIARSAAVRVRNQLAVGFVLGPHLGHFVAQHLHVLAGSLRQAAPKLLGERGVLLLVVSRVRVVGSAVGAVFNHDRAVSVNLGAGVSFLDLLLFSLR